MKQPSIFERVLIIAPNMQHSYCGVSDYSLILGRYFEEEKNGSIRFCSLNDSYTNEIIQAGKMLRIPEHIAITKKKKLFEELVSSYQPSLLILNYAAYGFHKKGFPFWLADILSSVKNASCAVVIVFHELWIGHFAEENFKAKILGKVQKLAIKRLVQTLQPIKIFVTTQIAQKMLESISIKSNFLNVFNNLGNSVALSKEEEDVLQENVVDNKECLLLSFFGSIFSFIDTGKIITFLEQQAFVSNKKIIVLTIGKLNDESLQTWNRLSTTKNESIKFIQVGMVSANLANAMLQQIDYGLSPYPIAFWSKSGSIAAMLANGLSVIAVGVDISTLNGHRKKLDIHPLVLQLDNLPNGFVLQKRIGQHFANNFNEKIYKTFVKEIPVSV